MTFGHKGQVYDGERTADAAAARRHGGRAGSAGARDTRVTGNYPPQISAEAAYVVGHPPVEELVEKTQ